MADAAQDDQYRVPAVFAEAHARGFAGLALAPNPDKLVDPVTGQPVAPEAYHHETVLKRRAPNATKRASRSEIAELRARAERAIGSYPERPGVRYVIYNTSAVACAREFGASRPVEVLAPEDYRRFIEGTAERMLGRLEEARPTPRRA